MPRPSPSSSNEMTDYVQWSEGRIVALLTLAFALLIAFILIQIWKPDQATVPPKIFIQRSIFSAFWLSSCVGIQTQIFGKNALRTLPKRYPCRRLTENTSILPSRLVPGSQGRLSSQKWDGPPPLTPPDLRLLNHNRHPSVAHRILHTLRNLWILPLSHRRRSPHDIGSQFLDSKMGRLSSHLRVRTRQHDPSS